MNKRNDLLASLKDIKEKREASHARKGKAITLHRCAKPEMRIFIRDENRQLRGAGFTDAPVRYGYAKSRKRYYYASGATTIREYEICKMARESEWNFAKFKRVLAKRLGREIAPSEAREFIEAAIKGNNVETLCFAKYKVPKGVTVYAKK